MTNEINMYGVYICKYQNLENNMFSDKVHKLLEKLMEKIEEWTNARLNDMFNLYTGTIIYQNMHVPFKHNIFFIWNLKKCTLSMFSATANQSSVEYRILPPTWGKQFMQNCNLVVSEIVFHFPKNNFSILNLIYR